AIKASDGIFTLGYETGYKDGFKDGYSRGYADGYRDGYAIGHKHAWEQANQVIRSLQDQLVGYQKALDDARKVEGALRDELRRRNSIGGYLSDLGEGVVKGVIAFIGL